MESFRFLGDDVCPGDCCKLDTLARTQAAWRNFLELLPLPSSLAISLARCGMLFNSCVTGDLLHASEGWALRREDIQRLFRIERVMLRWMCKVKAEDDVCLHDLYSRVIFQALESRLRINRLRWYGHVERSEDWIKRCTQIDVSGSQGRGRPRKPWKESVTGDLRL